MMRERSIDRELYWRGVLQRQRESGLNVASYCRQESLSAASFYAWRRKLQERDVATGRAGLAGNGPTNLQLVPVQIESKPPSDPVRILLPQGVSIDAPSGIDRNVLADLLGALRAAQLC